MEIRYHLDEHVDPAVAKGLRQRGVDVTTTVEAGLAGASDDGQLAFAAADGRVFVTRDRHFLVLHGEGVAIGMIQAFRFSERQKLCPPGTADRVARHLETVGLPVHASQIPGELPPPGALLDIMRQDKKAQAGKLTFILARGIGDAFIAHDVADHDVLGFLTEDLQQR